MHSVVMDSLEEYLSGTLDAAQRTQIDAHLGACGTCRESIEGMLDVSELLGCLRSEAVVEPSAGFLAGILRVAGERKAARSLAAFFMPDLVLARRLVFASLLTLAVLGGYLVSRESGNPGGMSPEALMAQQDSPAFDSAPAPDNMLVTLTAYDRR